MQLVQYIKEKSNSRVFKRCYTTFTTIEIKRQIIMYEPFLLLSTYSSSVLSSAVCFNRSDNLMFIDRPTEWH